MKFKPRKLDPEVADVSRGHDRHPLRELALLTAGVSAICAVIYLAAILVADLAISRISPATESRLFASLRETLPKPASLDPLLDQRRQMAERLLARLLGPTNDLHISLVVWDTPVTNAVALPGGTLALTRGLLECLDTESGMAFVLAHELGHFQARDQLRGLSRQLGLQVVVSLVLGSQTDVGMGAFQAGQFALLAHSRKRESAADRYALELMHRRLGKTEGAAQFFELLEKDRLPGWAYMFHTHPATDQRRRELHTEAVRLNTQIQTTER